MKHNKMIKKLKKGASKVGRVLASPFKWAGSQIEKEMRMNEAKDKKYSEEGRALNKKYSGLQTNKSTIDMLRRGMRGEKK
jgi:hypothetical protein